MDALRGDSAGLGRGDLVRVRRGEAVRDLGKRTPRGRIVNSAGVVEVLDVGRERGVVRLVRGGEERDLHLVDELLDLLACVPDAEVALELLPRAGLLDLAGGVGEVVGLVRVERADGVKSDVGHGGQWRHIAPSFASMTMSQKTL